MPSVLSPLSLASLNAARLSAVSPDWLITITSPLGSNKGFLYLNSEASSTLTGILARSSITYCATTPTWYAEPQATIYICEIFLISSSESSTADKSSFPSFNTELSVSAIAFGCSWISFIIKCSYPPFSAASASHLISTSSFSISSPSRL